MALVQTWYMRAVFSPCPEFQPDLQWLNQSSVDNSFNQVDLVDSTSVGLVESTTVDSTTSRG
eukprot:357995-Chlamydomonas_euryale.AAC.4